MNDKLLNIFAVMKFNDIEENDLDKAIKDNINIVNTITLEAILDKENESDKLLKFYKECSEIERAVIDNILLFICGWTMKSLIKKSRY